MLQLEFGPPEKLTSCLGEDGRWHAHYPTATQTLCGQELPPSRRGRKSLPDCGVCSKAARAFDRIDRSMPAHWRPDEEEIAA